MQQEINEGGSEAATSNNLLYQTTNANLQKRDSIFQQLIRRVSSGRVSTKLFRRGSEKSAEEKKKVIVKLFQMSLL